MPKFHVAQNSFNGGVIGRLLRDRYDLKTYGSSLLLGKNAFPLTEGPFTKRPGSIFVADVSGDEKPRLIPFKFSKDVKYVIEFTPNKARFFKNRALLDYSLDTGLSREQYEDIYTAQLSDLLLMVSGQMPPKQLKRINDLSWEIKNIEFYDGPYGDTNITDTELYCSGKTGTVNLNSTTDLFTSDDVGRAWRLRSGNGWAWGVCVSYTNAKQIVIDVKEGEMPISPYQTKLWKKGLMSNTTNFPTVACIHAKRLWLGGFKDNPSLIVASKDGDFFNFAPASVSSGAVADDNAIAINLSSSGVNDIQFIEAGDKGLDIGTSGGIWIIDTSDGYVTPAAFADLKNNQGAYGIQPIVTGPSVIYVQRSGKKVMDIQYSFTEDGYNAPELSLYNRDYMVNGLKHIDYQQDPISCLWCLDNKGKLYSMNYDKPQSVYAWVEQDVGDEVESFTIIPSSSGDSEDIWIATKRLVGGEYKRYIEYIPSWEEMYYEERHKLVFCDCAIIRHFDTAVDFIDGLERLEGRDVAVLGDGNHLGIYAVNNGRIELAEGVEINDVVVGIVESMEMATLAKNYGFTNGTTLHRKKELSRIRIGLLASLGGEYNLDGSDKYYPLVFFNSSVNLDTNVPLFTGMKEIDARTINDEIGSVYIRHRQGLPFTVTSITFDLENL
jgi:hypothetical protein